MGKREKGYAKKGTPIIGLFKNFFAHRPASAKDQTITTKSTALNGTSPTSPTKVTPWSGIVNGKLLSLPRRRTSFLGLNSSNGSCSARNNFSASEKVNTCVSKSTSSLETSRKHWTSSEDERSEDERSVDDRSVDEKSVDERSVDERSEELQDNEILEEGELEDERPEEKKRETIDPDLNVEAPPLELQEFIADANRCIEKLNEIYGAESGLSRASDCVIVMEGWNKALAFQTMFTEALLGKWRILVATEELVRLKKNGAGNSGNFTEDDEGKIVGRSPMNPTAKAGIAMARIVQKALEQVERNTDPISFCLGARLDHARTLLLGMLDCAARSLCPHTQVVQRESYRPINEDVLLDADRPAGGSGMHRFALQQGSLHEYFRLFARCGIRPEYWVSFCDSFIWCMKTHNPYRDEVDEEDLNKPREESAYSAFVAGHVAKHAIKESISLRTEMDTPLYKVSMRRFWSRITADDEAKHRIGETFYRQILTNNPELLDYFAKADMDSLAVHIVMAIDLMVKSVDKVGIARTAFRKVLDHLGEMHRRLSIPTFAFHIVGGQLLKTLAPFLKEEEALTKGNSIAATADELEQAFAVVYMEVMSLTYHHMVREEKLVAEAEDFLENLAKELNWSPDKLSRRLLEVKLEISASGTYTHTTEELVTGARLAWRNSAKCIGRIAWNTLIVRDCRHIETAADVFRDVEEHLRIATAGTNIQSVMTVYRPRSPAEAWGMRFWSSQFVRYAGYKQGDGSVMGDPANLEFTEYLVKHNLWKPPQKRSHFDVLPLVLKLPGIHMPFVHQLPPACVDEVAIEHPTCQAVKSLGLRWAAIPAISDFNMNLGGVDYQCCPFNGWFVSIEIVRNLLERYKITHQWAVAMGLDKNQSMLEMRVQHEVQVAILHSFEKSGFTMVDPVTVGNSFMVHCKRERDAGRECPAQWSWIGGLVGPTNITWHKEMRDFRALPQYDYSAKQWMVTDISSSLEAGGSFVENGNSENSDSGVDAFDPGVQLSIPRILIVYGSETGTAEAAAIRIGRALRLCKPVVKTLDDVAGLKIIKEQRITHFIALCSTFNRGQFPSNAQKFSETGIAPDTLANVKVAVLGLGSTLYPDYCSAGIRLDQMIMRAGGKALVPMTKVNEATGSEGAVSDWIQLIQRLVMPKHLETALRERLATGNSEVKYKMKWRGAPKFKLEETEPLSSYKWKEGDSTLCVGNDELITNGDVKSRSTRKVTFKLPRGVTYVSGDHLSVHPLNSLETVLRFARCVADELVDAASLDETCPFDEKKQNFDALIAWQLSQPFDVDCIDNGETYPAQLVFGTPATLCQVLQVGVDLSLRPGNVSDLLELANKCIKPIEEKQLDKCADSLRTKLRRFYQQVFEGPGMVKQAAVEAFNSEFPTMVDFLEEFSPLLCSRRMSISNGQKIPLLSLAQLLTFLPRLQSRQYSISSSPSSDPSKVSISVGVVHVKTPAGVAIHGVCSNYLARLRPGEDRARISVRSSPFRAPTTVDAPVIMVGTGTGLAPMMGFITDRANAMDSMKNRNKAGECHLFFGCRSHEDRIYADVVDAWESAGVVHHHLALSRSQYAPKMYVQDLLLRQGKTLCRILLRDDTHYYICGDAKVADYCFETIVTILRRHGNMSRVAAVQHIKRMRAEKRWQFDLWGIISHFNEAKVELRKKEENSAKTWLLNFADQNQSVRSLMKET